MFNYAKAVSNRATHQQAQAKDNQVKNTAGGYSFATSDWQRLNRFLILGSEGGAYGQSELKLTRDNAKCVARCAAEDGLRTVAEIVRVSHEGKAPKNDAAIFALALVCCDDNINTRKAAFDAIPQVCRIGTHLFQFVQNVKELRSLGRGLRDGIARWYSDKDVNDIAFQICKYAQRNGMSHRDVLRLVHPKAPSAEHDAIYRYIVTGPDGGGERAVNNKKTGKVSEYAPVVAVPEFLGYFEELKHADEKRTIELITQYNFTHEMIDTRHKNSPEVWEALLQKMPLTAMIRNLNKMTAIGLIKPFSQAQKLVCERLTDEDRIKKSRLHPLNILVSQRTYQSGRGDKGSLTWSPDQKVVEALESAFYKSFDTVTPTGKNFFLGLDVSGSMGRRIQNSSLTSSEIVGCIAMVTLRTEPNAYVFGYCDRMVDLNLSKNMSLADVQRRILLNNWGATDCAMPMIYAEKNNLDVDLFSSYTDGNTWAGSIHPFQALKSYRNKMGKPNAKSIYMTTEATSFSLADPSDPNSLDISGFSTDVPQVISSFAVM